MPEIPQDALPIDVPDTAQVKWPTGNNRLWGGLATWTRYKGKHCTCGVCQLVTHELGWQNAPANRPAAEKRKGPNGETLVCSLHAVDWKRRDDDAARARDERIAENERRRKAAAHA